MEPGDQGDASLEVLAMPGTQAEMVKGVSGREDRVAAASLAGEANCLQESRMP
jgi:hypothetical protein